MADPSSPLVEFRAPREPGRDPVTPVRRSSCTLAWLDGASPRGRSQTAGTLADATTPLQPQSLGSSASDCRNGGGCEDPVPYLALARFFPDGVLREPPGLECCSGTSPFGSPGASLRSSVHSVQSSGPGSVTGKSVHSSVCGSSAGRSQRGSVAGHHEEDSRAGGAAGRLWGFAASDVASGGLETGLDLDLLPSLLGRLPVDAADGTFSPQPNLPPGIPTVGSMYHHIQKCRPCVWFWKAQGCQRGARCLHCHLDQPGAFEAQREAKTQALKAMGVPKKQHRPQRSRPVQPRLALYPL